MKLEYATLYSGINKLDVKTKLPVGMADTAFGSKTCGAGVYSLGCPAGLARPFKVEGDDQNNPS